MAQVNIDVAKEESVQGVNTKVGTSSDTASNTPTTLFAGIKGLISWFTSVWTAARATKLDSIQTTLNTPDGNTLGAWIQALQNASNTAINLLNNGTYGLSALKIAITGGNIPVVKSVQRGVVNQSAIPIEQLNLENGTVYLNISISSINIGKSFVIINNKNSNSSNSYSSICELLNSNTLRFSNTSSYGSGTVTYNFHNIAWQVIEFY